ncbi:spore germination protein [Lentibacillus songyuanensis]|uniref:spore germination protein n=1 Tax=Lentibacillus songyuanensis TaxID=3136161 RepID=UPI0031BAE8CC
MVDLRKTYLTQIQIDQSSLQYIKENVLTVDAIDDLTDSNTLFQFLLSGSVILLFEGYNFGFAISMIVWEDIGVTEAKRENTLRGSKASLTDNFRTNSPQIQRIIRDPNLWFETRKIGTITKTKVSLKIGPLGIGRHPFPNHATVEVNHHSSKA